MARWQDPQTEKSAMDINRVALEALGTAEYLWLTDLLFRHDPIGINYDTNVDEYAPEAGTILSRLASARSEEDVLRIVHAEFVRWFSPSDAGTPSRYTQIAAEVWAHLQSAESGNRAPAGSSKSWRVHKLIQVLHERFGDQLHLADFWEADLDAVGLSSDSAPNQVLYVSVHRQPDERFFIAFEDMDKGTRAAEGDDNKTVDWIGLRNAVQAYLKVSPIA